MQSSNSDIFDTLTFLIYILTFLIYILTPHRLLQPASLTVISTYMFSTKSENLSMHLGGFTYCLRLQCVAVLATRCDVYGLLLTFHPWPTKLTMTLIWQPVLAALRFFSSLFPLFSRLFRDFNYSMFLSCLYWGSAVLYLIVVMFSVLAWPVGRDLRPVGATDMTGI